MIELYLADGFEEIEALATADILRRAGLELCLVGVGGLSVTGAHGIKVTADCTVDERGREPEMLVLPGGMPGAANLAASEGVRAAVRGAMDRGAYIGAICAAPGVVLSPLGALDGRRWTCYPGFETERGVYTGEGCVCDGRLITANGPGAAFEFALALAQRLAPQKAASLRREFCR